MELAVGYLGAWVIRKTHRAGTRADGHVDEAIDIGVDRLGELIANKLRGDPALKSFETEISNDVANERTRTRVQLAIEDAVEHDPTFASTLQAIIKELQSIDPSTQSIVGNSGLMTATHGSTAIGLIHNSGTLNILDPTQPGR